MGGHKKPIEGGCQKRGAWTCCQFKGGDLPRQRGGVLLRGGGGLYPNANNDLV